MDRPDSSSTPGTNDPWTNGPVVKKHAKEPDWERKLITDIATSAIKEQRRARRWGIFFKLLFFAYITFIGVVIWQGQASDMVTSSKRHTALINIEGTITNGTDGTNANTIIESLQAAYKSKGTVGIIINVNSPGGSPVQSGLVYDEIKRQKALYPDIPVYAVIGEVCASGCYYIIAASDRIYADKASLVGSIGVRMDGFGFVDAMKLLGVERRLLTAGENKAFLDPFSPLREDEKAHAESLLKSIHQQFIDVVKEGRGDKIAHSQNDLFSGLIWTGEQGMEKGLIDDLGSVRYVAREIIKEKHIIDFTQQDDLLQKLTQRISTEIPKIFKSLLSEQQSINLQ